MMLPLWKTPEARLIEKNMYNAFLAMSYDCKNQDNIQYLFSKIPHPIFNCVIKAETNSANAKRTIQDIFEDYQKANIDHAWWLSERSTPHNIDQLLMQYGFQKGPTYFGMHAKLDKLNLNLENESTLHIEMVQNIQNLDQWIKPIQESFLFSEEMSDAFLHCLKKLFVKNNQMRHFLAFFDNQLAGAATLFLDEDSAGFYNGAVLPVFRNRGVMTALGQSMAQEAKKQGYQDVIIQVSDTIYTLSKKNGFKPYLNYQTFLSPQILSNL